MQGLRERKKAARRQAISDVATRLFEHHGFEQVTVTEIAAAADVSVKTVFNYFHSKEELFFDREAELQQALLDALRERGAGVSATAAMRPLFLEGPVPSPGCRWSDLGSEFYEQMRAFIACERASPALTARRLMIAQSWGRQLAREGGSEAWAAMLLGVMNLRHEVLATALLERRAPRTVERRVRSVVGGALDALECGFAG
jgi:AcrR family transcriptional regulator